MKNFRFFCTAIIAALTTVFFEHNSGMGLNGLECYYGAGGHAVEGTGRIYSGEDSNPVYPRGDYYGVGSGGIGIDGVLGLEYKIPPVPFAISFDIKPFLEFDTHGYGFMALDPGFGIKFIF